MRLIFCIDTEYFKSLGFVMSKINCTKAVKSSGK